MTEQECRAMRLDKLQFKTLEDAIDFGEENNLQTRNIYKYPDGYFKICRFTKTKADLYGRFIAGKYVDGGGVPIQNSNINSNRKKVDGRKFDRYLTQNGIKRIDLCASIHRSKAFVNDVIRNNDVDILAWEKICDILGVPNDFFDIKEYHPEPKEQPKVLIEETDHDLLVSLLLSQEKIEALLMEIVSMLK